MYESVAHEKPTMYNGPPRANSVAVRLLSLKLDKDNILLSLSSFIRYVSRLRTTVNGLTVACNYAKAQQAPFNSTNPFCNTTLPEILTKVLKNGLSHSVKDSDPGSVSLYGSTPKVN